MKDQIKIKPDSAGNWQWRENDKSEWRTVEVSIGDASGIYCVELKQGGSAQCGFEFWSGEWKKD